MAEKKSNKSLWVMLALIVVILVVILLLPGCGNRTAKVAGEVQATTLVEVGDTAPDFVVGMFDGTQVRLSELRGKVVLLNFWATWCPPCRAELARVGTDVIERFAGHDFVFLPLSRGESRSDVEAFREKNGYDFPMGLDSTKAVYGLYASNYIPRNFLIDREGKIVATSVGYDTAEFDELIRTIEKTLENQ